MVQVRTSPWLVPLSIGVVVGVVLSGSALGVWQPGAGKHTTPAPPNPGNGITFDQAWRILNQSVSTAPDGPWTLVDVLGIATQVPEGMDPTFSSSLNETMTVCQALHGVTIWNGTGIPSFNGSLNAGAAPFWSFILQNSTDSYLYSTVLLGVGHVFPVANSTACVRETGLGTYPEEFTPLGSANLRWTSTRVAERAYNAYGQAYARLHSPMSEYYVLGPAQLVDLDTGPGWGVDYFRCGLTGVWGIQNLSVYLQTPAGVSYADIGWLGCTVDSYNLSMSVPQNVTPNGAQGSYLGIPFQATFYLPVPKVIYYDADGLQAWMLRLNVSQGGVPLQPDTPGCLQWVPALQDCGSNSSGWYAVLLSATGQWLDSYPSLLDHFSWTVPAVPVTSQDQLVIVGPSGSSFSSEKLSVSGVLSGPTIAGSTTL
jgi:hypothetical protein